MTHSGSADSLPRFVADGLITIVGPGHARFGKTEPIDVHLTPNNGATILGPMPRWAETDEQRDQIVPIDAVEGLKDFKAGAEQELGHEVNTVSVGIDTIAQLFAQRALRQQDLVSDRLRTIEQGVWEINIPPTPGGFETDITLRFAAEWNGSTQAGNRTT